MIRRTIILFRNPDLTQNFTEPFEKLGLSICCIPVLEFDYERYQNHLRNTNFEAAKGIIFPSQRAVIALSRLNLDLKHLK